MARERIVLALIAIVAGLLLTSSIFYFYRQQQADKEMVKTPSPTVTAVNGKTLLEIESPENELVTDVKTIEIKGKSQPNALIVLTTNTEDFVFSADANGMFTKEITLSANENLITITAYTESGTSETKEFNVTYTQEEF